MGTAGIAVEAPVAFAQVPGAAADVLAVVEKGDRRLAFFDAGSGRRLSDLVLGDFPHELVADAERRFAYVGHYGVEFSGVTGQGGSSVFVVDLRLRTLVRTIDIAPFNRVHGMGMDDTGRLYALSEEKATLLGFDAPATATAPSRAVGTGAIKTHLFSVTRSGERAYVTGLLSHTVSLVRPHDASVAPVLVTPGQLPESSCLSRDERTLYVGARRTPAVVAVDAHSMRVKDVLEVAGDPLRVYTVSDDQLLVTDLANKKISLISTVSGRSGRPRCRASPQRRRCTRPNRSPTSPCSTPSRSSPSSSARGRSPVPSPPSGNPTRRCSSPDDRAERPVRAVDSPHRMRPANWFPGSQKQLTGVPGVFMGTRQSFAPTWGCDDVA
jgi:hypothetical protein